MSDTKTKTNTLAACPPLTDVLGRTIDAAETYAAQYDGDDRQDIKTDVLNAFYAGTEFGKTVRSNG